MTILNKTTPSLVAPRADDSDVIGLWYQFLGPEDLVAARAEEPEW